MSILDKMLRPKQFTPVTVDEYIALRLAKRLGDEASVSLYLNYFDHHSKEWLIANLHKAMRQSDPARAFHSSLASDHEALHPCSS